MQKPLNATLVKNEIAIITEFSRHVLYVDQILSLQIHLIPASGYSEIPLCWQNLHRFLAKSSKCTTDKLRKTSMDQIHTCVPCE